MPRRRRGPESAGARRRARKQAESIGGQIALSRAELALSIVAASRRAGVTPQTFRRIENGDPGIQLDMLCAVGEAVSVDVVVSGYPGRQPRLRDTGQLILAEFLVAIAHRSWQAQLEIAAGLHGEAADLGFIAAGEIVIAEIDRRLVDFQAQYRRNSIKRDFLAAQHQRPVRLVMVIEDTERNRAAIAPHLAFIRTALPADSRAVLHSIRSGTPLGRDGLLWLRRRRGPSRSR